MGHYVVLVVYKINPTTRCAASFILPAALQPCLGPDEVPIGLAISTTSSVGESGGRGERCCLPWPRQIFGPKVGTCRVDKWSIEYTDNLFRIIRAYPETVSFAMKGGGGGGLKLKRKHG